MKTMTERLREFRINELAKIVPASEYKPEHECGVCKGPASHEPGRHSDRIFVVPAGCGHPVYPLEHGPGRPIEPMTYEQLMRA